jgi:hypothetical protein
MNTRKERAMNSENLGTRITENGALDQKIWGLEAFGGGHGLFTRFWGNYGFFGVVGRFWGKRQGLLHRMGFFWGIFMEFWSV